MKTSVAIILFNRPDLTEEVFRVVAAARPSHLFLIADGPRADHPLDRERCAAARAVVERIDWSCDVHRNYADVNLGCGRRPASGISWVFEHVDEAIILEDDCVPHPSFFRYCDEMLERYRDEPRIMLVSGHDAYAPAAGTRSAYSYRVSRLVDTLGWGTWSRAWKSYDIQVARWPALRPTLLRRVTTHPAFVTEWTRALDRAYAERGDVDYWDYQWAMAVWERDGLAVVPSVNLVANHGFRPDATHTTSPDDPYARAQVVPMAFPLRHPLGLACDVAADQRAIGRHYARHGPMVYRLVKKLMRTVRRVSSAR